MRFDLRQEQKTLNNASGLKVVLLFYSNLGDHSGKGNESFYVVNELKKSGYLAKVVVLSNKAKFDFNVIEETLLVRKISGVFSRIEKYVFKKFPSRLWSENIFDLFAKTKLEKAGRIFYSSPRMVCSLERAKKIGYITILHSGELHPLWNIRLIEEEYQRFGIKSRYPGWDARLFKRYIRSIQLADYIVVHSDFAKQNYISQGIPEHKIFVNPLGVDIDKFCQTKKSKKEFFCLFVGHISIIKGVKYLMDAWNSLKFRDAKLLICGNIGMDFKEILLKYPFLKNIEFTGSVNPIPYYRKASIFVFPSLSEGMARVTLEAMAMGLPVITTPNAGSVVRNGVDGFIIPARDTDTLKEKIQFFYENRGEVERMGNNAREQAKNYSWVNYGRRSVCIIETIARIAQAK